MPGFAQMLLLALVTVASLARADAIVTREVAGPVVHPTLVRSERACSAGKEAGVARTKSLTWPGGRAEILHACEGVPAGSQLAIQTDAGWFIEDGFTIEDIGGNMSDPRFHFALVDESLARGTIADGSPAIVYRSISRHDLVARSGAIVESQLVADVLICVVQAGVRCGRIAYTCPNTGCGPATLALGVLTTIEERRHPYTP